MNRRPNGFGSLIFKGEGKPWLARWVYKGQVYYKTTGESDKKKALKKLEYITRPYRESREIDVIRSLQNRLLELQECRTMEELSTADIWEVFAKKLKKDDVESGTTSIYENAVHKMVEWMTPKVKLAKDITSKLAEEYLEHLSDSVGAATYNIRLVLFKRIWKALSGEYRLEKDVWESFKKKKVTKSTRRTVSSFEIGKVLSAAESFDMKLLLTIGIYTGLRLSDCALLKWSDIDMEHKIIRTIPLKTRKHMDAPLEIPIHPTLLNMLHEAANDGEYVSDENASAYKDGKLSGQVVDLFKSCGIETSKKVNGKTKLMCGFHSLRHTFVSMAVNSGMSPLLVQRIVGHSAVSMTEAYYHDNMDKMTEGINALPDVM